MNHPSPQEPDPLIGQMLGGQYQVEALIARGGMGSIYRGRQIRLGREYAIKILRKEYCADAKVVKRFVREALAVSQLRHPHTVQVFDTGETPDGIHFIVMEYLEGTSLDRRLMSDGGVDPESAVRFTAQAAAALAEAHKKGIVHRDLKPANIFIVQSEEVREFIKILDFGIAKFYTGAHEKKELTKLTAAGSTMGTPHYMAPEQIRGEDVDGRADVYSLGIILWECLVGTPPYSGDSPMEIFLGHLEQPLPPASSASSMPIPPQIDAVIQRASTKDRAYRFQTMSDLKAALDGVTSQLFDPAAALASQQMQAPHSVRTSQPLNVGGGDSGALLSGTEQAAPTAPERRAVSIGGSRLLLYVALAAIVLVGIIGIVLILTTTSDAPESDDGTAAAAPTAHVKVYSEPPGAKVVVDGQEIGETPVRLDAPADTELDLELVLAGYETIDLALTPETDRINGAVVVMSPLDGATPVDTVTRLWVDSEPSGAQVTQDGRRTGLVTPVSLQVDEGSGTSDIEIAQPGFVTERFRVTPRGGTSIALTSTLIPEGGVPPGDGN